jgi:hypothetical protein
MGLQEAVIESLWEAFRRGYEHEWTYGGYYYGTFCGWIDTHSGSIGAERFGGIRS